MGTLKPAVAQLHDFTDQFTSGAFSDCRVKCGARTWNLHKVILCARSQFFAGAFSRGFGESVKNEIILEEQDPDNVDKVLRYIYSCNLSHLDLLTADDVDGMKLAAYKLYIPLYILGDFLSLPSLCRDLLGRLHRANRRLAAHIQRLAVRGRSGDGTDHPQNQAVPVILDGQFEADLAACAKLAYSIPSDHQSPEEVATALPGGIRNIFVELFEFIRYQALDDSLLGAISADAPELLVDIIRSMRAFGTAGGLLLKTRKTCVDCHIDPLTGYGERVDSSEQYGSFFTGSHPTSNANFWVRGDLCFQCSVYYPRKTLLALVEITGWTATMPHRSMNQ